MVNESDVVKCSECSMYSKYGECKRVMRETRDTGRKFPMPPDGFCSFGRREETRKS
jgi:hypothetical protein